MATLEHIWIKRARRGPMDPLPRATLVSGRGILGNVDEGRTRQVTILLAERWEALARELGGDLDPASRRANLLVRGLELERVRHRVLCVGRCRLLVHGETRPCERMDDVREGLQRAMRSGLGGGLFAEVLDGGDVAPGDPVAWEDAARTPAATVHGRYLVKAPARSKPFVWIVGFHGYGTAADAMLASLATVPGSDDCLVVSVQGLHRFYSRTSEVVASWMTREDRDHAIADNLAYVGTVLDELRASFGEPTRLVFAGFSQGVAMAWRAAVATGVSADGIVALAGDIPPELRSHLGPLTPRVLLGRGRTDRLYGADALAADVNVLRTVRAPHRVVEFDGAHEWHADFSASAGEWLAELVRG